MVMNPLIKTLEDVDESLREHYAKRDDGTYFLQVDGDDGYSLAQVANLRKAMNQERALTKDLEGQLAKFAGIENPEAAVEAIEQLAALGDDADIKKKVDTATQERMRQIAEQHRGELATVNDRSTKLLAALGREKVDNKLATMLQRMNVDPKKMDQVLPWFKQRVKGVANQDGTDLDVMVIDPGTGSPMVSHTDPSQNMTLEQLGETTLKEDAWQHALMAKKISGTQTPTGGPAPIPGPGDAKKLDRPMTGAERIAAARASIETR